MPNKPQISIIVAIGPNREIGKKNQLLWKISADLKHFKEITTGHPVIMGYNTYLSIGRLLPNRTNIILSKDANLKIEGAIICNSIEAAIKAASAHDKQEIFFIGGGQVYHQALPFAEKLYLTLVDGKYDADSFFPPYASEFVETHKSPIQHEGDYSFKFVELQRK